MTATPQPDPSPADVLGLLAFRPGVTPEMTEEERDAVASASGLT